MLCNPLRSRRSRALLCAANLLCAALPARTHAESSHAQAALAGVVNINTATAQELERLPGIGPSRSRAILELRTKLRRFERLEQLLQVKGIGRATFRKLRPLLALQGPTTLLDP